MLLEEKILLRHMSSPAGRERASPAALVTLGRREAVPGPRWGSLLLGVLSCLHPLLLGVSHRSILWGDRGREIGVPCMSWVLGTCLKPRKVTVIVFAPVSTA